MSMSKTNTESSPLVLSLLGKAGEYVKERWHVLVVFLVSFAVATVAVYVDTSTTDTVASYTVEDYEVGQVADRTIFATKSMPADEVFPVAIEEGEKVIRKGFPISEEEYLKLRKMAASPAYIDYRAFSNSVLFLMLVAAFWFLLFSPALLGRQVELKEVVLEAVLFVIVFVAATFAGKSPLFQTVYRLPVAIPSALCVFMVAILFGQASALYFSLLLAMGVLAAAHFQLVPALFTLASCLCAARIVRTIERRIDWVFASIMLAVLNVVFMTMFKVIFNDSFSDAVFVLTGIAFNGFLSGILVLGLLTPLESLLNTASVFRLMDLSDLNTPVMRRMLLTAGGTYNHSMLVASLAENACKAIGANALLARVGAYYHDIGKMDQPEYFVENQGGGGNKHDDINPSLSASIIRSHVKRGVEKAHQLRLPRRIVDIIGEHHGNSVMAYFYNEAKQKDPNVSPESFAYMGNPPTSVESAVVMIADTVEAACRTLDKPSVPRLDKFIQTLIQAKIDHHQLDNCPLTFGDLTKIRESFVQILAGYYHSRIEYPNQKDPGGEEKSLSEAGTNAAPSAAEKTDEAKQ
ncbi:MAG: HDIG domain-containing protein [Treponemataceae bacterium]|nr:HDIG domain-containing protein [Treponemataceae bacterium]